MNIVFDQGVRFRYAARSHRTLFSTAFEVGWAELSNGELLKRANAEFDVLITTDQALRFQQNLSSLRLAIVILPTTDWSIIARHQDATVSATAAARPGEALILNWR